MKTLITFITLSILFGAENAQAEACPWAGASVTVNTQSLAAGDYDCSAQDITIAAGQTLTMQGNTGTNTGVVLRAQNLTVNGTISANGQGYPADGGPSPGTWGGYSSSGGGHGGAGGPSGLHGYSSAAGGAAYGSISQPITLGSGGGNANGTPGGAGGGAIRLVIASTLALNGTISADGNPSTPNSNNSAAGGGAGGSIWIAVDTISGGGTLTARGGNMNDAGGYYGGAGGGGRIALSWVTKTFSGTVSAAGGLTSWAENNGSAGTVQETPMPVNGVILLSNGTFAFSAADLVGVTRLEAVSGVVLTFSETITWTGDLVLGSASAVTVTMNHPFSAHSIQVLNGSTMNLKKGVAALGNIEVTGSSTIQCISDYVNNTGCGIISADNLTIASGSKIFASGLGYPMNAGPGKGSNVGAEAGSGGGHGGVGGASGFHSYSSAPGGAVYDSLTEPVIPGSGGASHSGTAGGAGGGAVRISINSTFTLNGSILADGLSSSLSSNNHAAGSGAGGAVWISANTFSGGGSISAKGGNMNDPIGYYGGSGGGGRIAVHYQSSTFSGTVTAAKGVTPWPENDGADGTVYMARNGIYVSPVLDFLSNSLSYQTLSFVETTPGTTTVSVDLRAGNSPAPDGTWTAWTNFSSGDSLAAFIGNRYLQYRATLSTTDANKPSLDSITINAPACYSTGSYYYVKTTSTNKFQSARSNTASNVAITSLVPGSTALKALVSFDGGTTWKKHNSSSWVDAAGGVSTIGTMGNTMAELISGLNGYTFGASEPTVDFAFGLESDSCSATPSVTELRFDY